MNDRTILAAIGALMLAVTLISCNDCHSRGGVLVRAVGGYECVQRR